MTTLWDTTGTAVVSALAAERRTGGAVTSGLALTLVVVADESEVTAVESAITVAAARHPMRVLLVIRRQIDAPTPRLDAEVLIGGRLGPGETVVMRMYGRLALHAESVTLPLLAPDAPVVTWWHRGAPALIAHDPLGVFADRRITDVAQEADPVAALRQRGADYYSGDTDLSWTRITAWRATLASAFDTVSSAATSARVNGDPLDPSCLLLAGWLSYSLGFYVPVQQAAGGGLRSVDVGFADGTTLAAVHDGSRMVLRRDNQPDTSTQFLSRDAGDLLAEELRRLDADQTYARALGAVLELPSLETRPSVRSHIWSDPALAGLAISQPAGEPTR